MPVIPYCDNLVQNNREIIQILSGDRAQFSPVNPPKIVSFSQKIEPVDPLAFLQPIINSNELHFYWENPSKQEAIAACGTAINLIVSSPNRFIQAQKFIQNCLKKTIRKGDINFPGAGPYFFCNFTFFAAEDNSDSLFPAATIFLPRFQVVQKNERCLVVANLSVGKGESPKLLLEKLKQQVSEINWKYTRTNEREYFPQNQEKTEAQLDKSGEFKTAVSSALKSIQKEEFSKVVLAHAIDVTSTVPFRLIESLDNLRQRHPDCYIFSTSNGKGNYFIGASPERLVSIQNQQLVTDALAGSAPRGKTTSEDLQLANGLLKSRKEKREHQAVSEFIIKRLSELGLTPRQLPLQVRQLSNIQHLWTPIYAHLPMDISPLEIVAQLHPTPAVAGVPTEIACEQIRRYETFDRSLYAAPLGWIDYQGNCEFIVGIRSALIKNNHARLYAGAGIVAGSDPEKEFAEIQLKLQSLFKALV